MIHCLAMRCQPQSRIVPTNGQHQMYSEMVATKLSTPTRRDNILCLHLSDYRHSNMNIYNQHPRDNSDNLVCVYKLYSRLLYILDFSIKEMLLFYWIKLEFYLVRRCARRNNTFGLYDRKRVVAMMIATSVGPNYGHDNCLVQSVNV